MQGGRSVFRLSSGREDCSGSDSLVVGDSNDPDESVADEGRSWEDVHPTRKIRLVARGKSHIDCLNFLGVEASFLIF